MRSFILLFFFSLLSFGVDISKATEEHDKAIATADAKFVKYLVGVVKKAPDTEKVEIYKLIAKYDPKNEEAAKFVAALDVSAGDNPGDLLKATVTTITLANASQVVKGYKSDKIVLKDWDSFPGEELKVLSKGLTKSGIKAKKGEQYLIMPCPEDRWQLNDTTAAVNWKGDNEDWMALLVKVVGEDRIASDPIKVSDAVIYKVTTDGILSFQVKAGGQEGQGIGSVRVKVLKVTP